MNMLGSLAQRWVECAMTMPSIATFIAIFLPLLLDRDFPCLCWILTRRLRYEPRLSVYPEIIQNTYVCTLGVLSQALYSTEGAARVFAFGGTLCRPCHKHALWVASFFSYDLNSDSI